MASLEDILLIGTKVTPEGVRRLRQALPEAKIRAFSPSGPDEPTQVK
jgi:hypothetical protein